MKRLLAATATSATMVAAALGVTAGPAHASNATHVHFLLTRPALHAVGVGTGCLSTLSPGCTPVPLQYGGGPVEQSGSTNYTIFWEPNASVDAPNYNSFLNQFFGDIGGSSLYGVATQYYQTVNGSQQHIVNSSSLGGTWTDTSAYPSGTLQDSDIQSEITKALAANPTWSAGIGHEFFVFLQKGENECMSGSCSFTTYCAYHGEFTNNGQPVLYAAMPYAGTDLAGCGIQGQSTYPNGPDLDAEASITSHELMETVTDPALGNGWVDATGSEIGDKCAYTYGPTSGNGADITMNGRPYVLQEEFSNSGLSCAI